MANQEQDAVLEAADLDIARVAEERFPSPLITARPSLADDLEPVLLASTLPELGSSVPLAFEAAGPRSQLAFDPREVRAAILTAGGLCPGLNNVIRAIVMTLHFGYGVEEVLGFRYGYRGLAAPGLHPPEQLDVERVRGIHHRGGTILGSSRGPQSIPAMVDNLEALDISMLFAIGGDGTLRGVRELTAEIKARGVPIAVVAVPKTIDNDLRWIERSFGFETAVAEAERAIDAAHVEARSALGGIGLVKLMGRHAGFIAAHASLSSNDVNFCLIPEVHFELEGEEGLLQQVEERLLLRGHAVVVVAEGAGQHLFDAAQSETDPSGNPRLSDIGDLLRARFKEHFEARSIRHTIKYIDPSYIIRSRPANTGDSELCQVLGQHAVHAAMAGRTDMMVGRWNQHYTHVPVALAVEPSRVDLEGETWMRVLEATGQRA